MSREERIAFLVALCILGGIALFNRGTPWAGEWNWTLAAATGSTTLSGPGVSAVAAWLMVQQRRQASVTDSTPRAWQIGGRTAVVAWLLGITVQVIILVAAIAVTVVAGVDGPFYPVSLVPTPFLLGAFAAFGAALGRAAPHLVTVALAGPLAFGIAAVGPVQGSLQFLRANIPTGSLVGLRWDTTTLLIQIASLLGVALVAWLRDHCASVLEGTSRASRGNCRHRSRGCGLAGSDDSRSRTLRCFQ